MPLFQVEGRRHHSPHHSAAWFAAASHAVGQAAFALVDCFYSFLPTLAHCRTKFQIVSVRITEVYRLRRHPFVEIWAIYFHPLFL
jgi:hypothetical protein